MGCASSVFRPANLGKIKLTRCDLPSALGRASMAHARPHPPPLYGPILSLLRNVGTFTVTNTLPNLQTQFWGLISTDPFNAIMLTVPTDVSWVVSDFTTAQALTSAVPEPST
jgi:hypothetical protein